MANRETTSRSTSSTVLCMVFAAKGIARFAPLMEERMAVPVIFREIPQTCIAKLRS